MKLRLLPFLLFSVFLTNCGKENAVSGSAMQVSTPTGSISQDKPPQSDSDLLILDRNKLQEAEKALELVGIVFREIKTEARSEFKIDESLLNVQIDQIKKSSRIVANQNANKAADAIDVFIGLLEKLLRNHKAKLTDSERVDWNAKRDGLFMAANRSLAQQFREMILDEADFNLDYEKMKAAELVLAQNGFIFEIAKENRFQWQRESYSELLKKIESSEPEIRKNYILKINSFLDELKLLMAVCEDRHSDVLKDFETVEIQAKKRLIEQTIALLKRMISGPLVVNGELNSALARLKSKEDEMAQVALVFQVGASTVKWNMELFNAYVNAAKSEAELKRRVSMMIAQLNELRILLDSFLEKYENLNLLSTDDINILLAKTKLCAHTAKSLGDSVGGSHP